MAIKNLNSRISWKKDTAANWSTNNPVLLNGEIVVVETASGEERFKIGDGTSRFNALPFQDEAVRNQIENDSKYPVPSGQAPTELQSAVSNLETLYNNSMPKSGGAFTGNVNGTATQDKSVGMFRNIFIVDGVPADSMGADGDLCFSL